MAVLKRDEILNANDLKTEVVSVPEWGGDVIVRMLTGKERDKFEEDGYNQSQKKKGGVSFENVRARLVGSTIVDETGRLVFDPADVAELGKKSAIALDRVFAVSQRLNGFTKEDVDTLAKNSEADPNANSTLP